jgi:hypothetical protein
MDNIQDHVILRREVMEGFLTGSVMIFIMLFLGLILQHVHFHVISKPCGSDRDGLEVG